MAKGVICCADAQCVQLAGAGSAGQRRAASIIHVRALAVPSMFPAALQREIEALPYSVACIVAPPEAVAPAYGVAAMGDTLVIVGGRKMGVVPHGATDLVSAAMGLLSASLGSALGGGQAQWEDDADNADPFEVLGVSPVASFEQVRAAWRARLAEYHPDKYAKAGAKIRTVAADESRRLNAAYARIAAHAKNKPVTEV